jgi:YD repeat-containing protein
MSVLAQVKQYVGWSSITNGTDLGNGSVRKTSTGAWDFTANALQTLLPGDGYFESTAANFNQSIGVNGANGQGRAIVIGSGGWAGIYENNVEVAGTYGHIPSETITPHAAGDRYRIEITNSVLRYIRYRGAVREVMFQSAAPLPAYPMTASLGMSPQNAEWQKTVLAQLTRKATWSSIANGIDLGDGSVRKTSTGTWDFSAVAAQTLARGDGYFESTASYWNHSINLTGSDGAGRSLLVGTGGWAAIYEGGVEVASTSPLGNITAHAAGDRYRLEISNSTLRYVRYRGGIRSVMYTSANAVPAYPITFSLGMSFQNSEWQNTVFAQLSNTVTWSSIANGIDLGNGSVRKTSTGTWDFSASARQQLVFGPGYFESTASYWNHSINLGGIDGAGRSLVAGTGGWAAVYENNVEVASTSPLGNLTPYAAGDRYRLELIAGKLRYVRYRSGARTIAFTSTNAVPANPLGFSLGMSFQNSEWQNTMFSDNVPEHNDAAFVSQTVPTTMTPGQNYNVIVTMRNTGTSTWTPDGDYQLGSENLPDNTRWGMSRVNLNAIVPPGSDATFSFMVTAPAAGSHSFQWRMVQQNVQRFGALTTNVNVQTVNNPPAVTLTSPAQNATFTAPATVAFAATATDSDGTITKVEFFQGSTKVGENTTSPYTFNWTSVPAGTYVLSAKATDNSGATTTSSTVNITVNPPNQPPTANLIAPTSGQIFSAPANITLTADAADADGIVTKVQFFQGATLLNEDTAAPFTFNWTNVPAGNYSLTAKAFDNAGATGTSAPVAITVNALPSVSLTAPTNGQVFQAPANITLTATASDSDGTITKVQFFQGTTLLNEDTSPPYSFNWNSVAAGNYSLTAIAFDNLGGTKTSAAVAITVNAQPTVSITSPANPTTFAAPANFTITSSASDSDGSISKVEFFSGGSLLGQDTTPPYTFAYSNVSSGTYVLTAKATDNLGGFTTSTAVTTTVTNAPTTSITTPSNNAVFDAASNITINASATDTDGSIAKVEFLKDSVVLGEDTTPPYSFAWNNVPTGNYVLTTRATDNLGITGTSAPVNISVLVATGVARLDPMNRTGGGGEDPLSRNYNWSLPLVNLPGRSGLDLGLSLSYNSLVWTKAGSYISFDDDRGFPSPGFRLGFPVLQGPFLNPAPNKNAYLLIGSDGSRTELRKVGSTNLYQAVDSSYLLLDATTMTLKTADGTQLHYVQMGTAFQCTEIKDRNGNFITINYDGSGRIDKIIDTLAREIKFNYTGSDLTSITQTWTMNNQQQPTYTWATFVYADQPIQTSFSGVTPVSPSTIRALTRVNLPDGSHSDFDYTTWGQVWKIRQYATSTDDYLLNYQAYNLRGSPMLATGSEPDCPKFSERHDWADNWNRDSQGNPQEAVTLFADPSPATIPDIGGSGTLTQVTYPDQTYQKVYFGSTATSPGWQNGLALLTEGYDVSGPRQRWAITTWTQDDTNVSYQLNPRVIETNVYDPSNRARKRIEYTTFNNLPDQTSCSYPTDIYEYGGSNAATVLRRSHTDYNMTDTYTTRRILGLPSAKYLCDGAQGEVQCNNTSGASLQSKTTFGYDESGSIQGDDNPVQHDGGAHYGGGVVAGRGNLSSVTRHDLLNPGQSATSTVQYNTAGSIVKMIDPGTHAIQISYADGFAANGTTLDSGLPLTLSYPTMVTDSGNYTIKTRYIYQFGAQTWKQAPLPNVTDNQAGPQQLWLYDSIGRLERVKKLVDNSYIRYNYGPNYIETFSTVSSVADEAHELTVFDGHRRAIAKAANHPGSSGGFKGRWFVYDVMGRISRQYNPVETNLETISASAPLHPYTWVPTGDDDTNNNGLGWMSSQQSYDWKGRPTITTNTDNTTRITSYAGCGCAGGEVVTFQDEGTTIGTEFKRRTEKVYSDALGRKWKNEVLNWDGTVYSTTVSVYNVRDQITNVKQYAGAAPSDASSTNAAASCPTGTCQETVSTFDGYGRLQSKHVPEQLAGTATVYEYNADDTIHKVTDARGASTTYTYNNGRHLVSGITYNIPAGITPSANVTFTYDAAGNRKSMEDGLGTQTYTYDSLSRLISEKRTFADSASPFLNGEFTLSYDYNLAGELKSITDSSGVTTDYGHDAAGQITGVTASGGATTYASGMTYRASGGLEHMDYGNSLKLDISYNSRLQKTKFDVTNSVGVRAAGWQYQYANDGQLGYSQDLRDNRLDRAYDYNHVSRLITGWSGNEARGDLSFPPTGPYKQTYGQDVWGNLTDRSIRVVGPFGFPATSLYHDNYVNNRNTGGSSQAWLYDEDGRLTNDRTRTYSFDVAGNEITNSESAISRSFDGDGQMLKKSQSGAVTYYLRSSVVKDVIDELNQSGQKQRGYVYRDGEMLAKQEGGSILWNHDEPSNTSSQWSNGSGGVTTRVEMDPLMTQVAEDNGFTGGGYSSGNPMGFYGNPSNMGAGCAARGAPIACRFNLPVPLNWISAMTFGFQITNYVSTTTNRTQVGFSYSSSNATDNIGSHIPDLGGGVSRIHIQQVPVTTTTLQTSYVFVPGGLYANPFVQTQTSGQQQQVVCKSKLPEKAARLILDAADKASIDPTLLSVTWRYESDFNDSPKPNPRYNKNGNLVGYDVGPVQISTNYYMTSPFTDGLPKAFTGNSFRFPNPFGPSKPNLDDFDQNVGFNGDVSQNLLAGARAFALDILPRTKNLPDGSKDLADAAGLYRAGSRSGPYQTRKDEYNACAADDRLYLNSLRNQK